MKLIIDISEENYKWVCDNENMGYDLFKMIANGTPLEKHDEEIIKETVASIWGKPPCDDCVSREAVIKLVKKGEYDITGETDNEMFLEEVNKLPSVQPKSKTGHWILDETDNSITCDKCGCLMWASDLCHGDAHYCPNCGARMESEDKE